MRLSLLSKAEPLKFVVVDLPGAIPKMKRGPQFVLVITDRFSKLVRSVPLRTITATAVGSAFLDHWVYAYGALAYVLFENGTKLVVKILHTACVMLGAKNYFTTACHSQTNVQTERFRKNLVNRLRRYVQEHQRDRDIYLWPLKYVSHLQVHRSPETTSFDVVLTRHPSKLVMTGVNSEGRDTAAEESISSVQ